jgi:hypothetical protein
MKNIPQINFIQPGNTTGETMTTRTEERSRNIRDSQDNANTIADRVSELSQRAQRGLNAFQELNINEATIPDAFENVPKLVSPRVHAWLDFAVTTYFLGIGTWFAIRRNKGAATAAFVNAGMVAGVSLFTDYQGTGEKPISFKLHGTLDAVQAATAALGPVLHGFAGEREAMFFYGQAANEVAVIATTDWDRGTRYAERREAA